MKHPVAIGLIGVLILGVVSTGIFLLRNGGPSASDGITPTGTQPDSPQPSPAPGPVERGRQAYFKHCVACHSPDTDEYVAGISLMGYFNDPPSELSTGTLFPRTDEAIRELLDTGTTRMPPLSGGMTPQEIDDILAYMHTL